MTIVAFDTSGQNLSAAVAKDETILTYKVILPAAERAQPRHTEILTPTIGEMMKTCEVPFTALDAVAYVSGPGSFTGLRIGAATAKGLACAHGIPVIGISTLQAVAETWNSAEERITASKILATTDARKNRYYSALFSSLGSATYVERLTDDRDATADEIFALAAEHLPLTICGPTLTVLLNSIPHSLAGHINFAHQDNVVAGMIRVAKQKFAAHEWENSASGPFYLRKSDIGIRKNAPRFRAIKGTN